MQVVRVRIGVIIVIKGQVLLVEHQKDGMTYWLIPGGGVNFGETVAECAKRELHEETNLDIELDKFLFSSESIAPDGSRHVVNLFFSGTVKEASLKNLKVGDEERLKSVAFIDIDDLDLIELHPPFGPQLKRMLKEGLTTPKKPSEQYLGNFWKNYPVL